MSNVQGPRAKVDIEFGLLTLDFGPWTNERKRMRTLLISLGVVWALASCEIVRADPPRRTRASAAAQAAPPPGTSDIWQVTYLGKTRIGYSHTLSRPVQIDGKSLIKTDAETHLTIKRFGQNLQIETREEEEELPGGEL